MDGGPQTADGELRIVDSGLGLAVAGGRQTAACGLRTV